jgi:hypothetical protein
MLKTCLKWHTTDELKFVTFASNKYRSQKKYDER